MAGKATVTLPTDEQILIVRRFAAPKHLVYEAYTTPELVERWWPGRRGEMTVAQIDLRVGGRWRYAMVAEGGFEVAFNGEFRELVPHERIVFTEAFEGPWAGDGDPAVNTATFTEADGVTTLELLMRLGSREERDAILATGMEEGTQEGLDLLEQVAISLA